MINRDGLAQGATGRSPGPTDPGQLHPTCDAGGPEQIALPNEVVYFYKIIRSLIGQSGFNYQLFTMHVLYFRVTWILKNP